MEAGTEQFNFKIKIKLTDIRPAQASVSLPINFGQYIIQCRHARARNNIGKYVKVRPLLIGLVPARAEAVWPALRLMMIYRPCPQ